jgi:hypothetical protein
MQIISPMRVTRSYLQKLLAPPETVFPLLCPVREVEWAAGWQPKEVYSHSGVAERDCIFVMPGLPFGPQGQGEPAEAIWVTTRYEPHSFQIEFVKVTPGFTVGKIEIRLWQNAEGGSDAEITYSYTALSPAGEAFMAGFTAAHYQHFMRQWENELNHFLKTGRKL